MLKMQQQFILFEFAAMAKSIIEAPFCFDACVESRAKWLAKRAHRYTWKDLAREFRAFCVEYAQNNHS